MLLVRHAWAGDRDDWAGDDRMRPLDERGRAQAGALVALLEPFVLEALVSSPYLRCVQTLEPLASARGLEIEQHEELGEERQANEGARLLEQLVDEDVAVCVHGGVQSAVLPADARFPKGCAWFLVPGDPPRFIAPPA